MIKSAIFDCDGTLLDSMGMWEEVPNDYLRSLGIEPRENLTEVFASLTLQQAAEYYIDNYNVPLTVPEILEGVNSMIERFYEKDAVPKEGVPEFLKELKEKGIKCCVATATPSAFIEKALKRLKLLDYFEFIISCHDIGKGKNVPDIYEISMERLGSKKEETFVFEDASHAAKTSFEAGFPTVSIYDRYERNQEAMKKYSSYHIESYKDLSEFKKEALL